MKMILAKTTKAFMLMTRFGTIEAFRPSVIGHCTEVDQFVSQQQVKVLDNDLPDNATDEEFKKFLDSHDGDWETALENFKLSLEGVEETGEGEKDPEKEPESEAPAPKKTTTRTTKAKS
ncbi:hypothetical protein KUL113_03690 [Tenacibaculum sp. KUL113]|nr:hypothetical protein KUL113_03690 [Tenacibaculum sp. KUL113]